MCVWGGGLTHFNHVGENWGRLAQLLSACYRCGRSGVQFPGRSNQAQCRQWLATAAMFLWSCVAQALNCGNGSRHSLHASAKYCEYNEDLIFDFNIKVFKNRQTSALIFKLVVEKRHKQLIYIQLHAD